MSEKTNRLSEAEADYMARALLMPKEQIWEMLQDIDFANASKRERVKLAYRIADKFSVPHKQVLIRLQEIALLHST